MKPTNDEICHALLGLGAASCALETVHTDTLHHLAELGLVECTRGTWSLTTAGRKTLDDFLASDEPPDLT